jgi:hypothetical protein
MTLNAPTFLSSQKFAVMTFEPSYISFKPEVPTHTRQVELNALVALQYHLGL